MQNIISDGIFNLAQVKVCRSRVGRGIISVVSFNCVFIFDALNPDFAPCKQLDVNRMCGLGLQAKIPLWDWIAKAYADFLTKAVA